MVRVQYEYLKKKKKKQHSHRLVSLTTLLPTTWVLLFLREMYVFLSFFPSESFFELRKQLKKQQQRCTLTVDGEVVSHAEGETIVFDSTYTHSAENDSDDVRIVLYIDFQLAECDQIKRYYIV